VAEAPKTDVARRLPRHETDNRVTFTVDGPRERVVRGRCMNVSEAGFGAVFAGEVEVSEMGMAKLTLSGLDKPLSIRAEVRNRHGFTHGLRFLDITPEQRRTIMRWVRSAAHEDVITLAAAEAMNQEPSHEPHQAAGEDTGAFPALKDPEEQKNGE
jgi:hypothetical protein